MPNLIRPPTATKCTTRLSVKSLAQEDVIIRMRIVITVQSGGDKSQLFLQAYGVAGEFGTDKGFFSRPHCLMMVKFEFMKSGYFRLFVYARQRFKTIQSELETPPNHTPMEKHLCHYRLVPESPFVLLKPAGSSRCRWSWPKRFFFLAC